MLSLSRLVFLLACLMGQARAELVHNPNVPTGGRSFSNPAASSNLLTLFNPCAVQRPGASPNPLPPQLPSPSAVTPPGPSSPPAPPPPPSGGKPPTEDTRSTESKSPPESAETETPGPSEKSHDSSAPLEVDDTVPEAPRLRTGNLEERVADFFTRQRCLSCHGPSSLRPLFEANGTALSEAVGKRIHEILQGARSFGGPMAQALSAVQAHLANDESDRKLVEEWARSLATVREEPPAPSLTEKTGARFPPLPAAQYKDLKQAIQLGHLKASDIVKADAVAKRLKGPDKPIVLNIGNTVNLVGSVNIGIIGGTFAGGKQKDQIAKRLETLTATVPDRAKEIFIYCACCDAETCPNVLGSLKKLREMGYSNIRVLDLPPFVEAAEWEKETGISIVPET